MQHVVQQSAHSSRISLPPEDVYARGMERLITVSQELSLARSLEEIQGIVRTAARQLTGADGATFVVRDHDECVYADEDAIAPLWKGKRFPLAACISGWAMLHRRPVLIEDIYNDSRIPADIDRPTFVKSLAIVPISAAKPIGAIGAYWARQRMPTHAELKLLQVLAESASIAMENAQLYSELEGRMQQCSSALESARRAEAEARREMAEHVRTQEALSSTQAQLRQAQKMEAIGQLAAGIAHDFNNVLTVILSYGNLVAQSLPTDHTLRPDVAEIVSAGERAAALTQQLLAFSRQQVLQPRAVDVDQVVRGLENMLQRLLGATVQLQVENDGAPHPTFADPSQLEQVVLNLAVNARDAMPEGGALRVTTRQVQLGSEHVAGYGVEPGPYVALTVADSGTGMPDPIKERIFEPFFTTKEKGKGTGLGLSTVYGIVKQSKGHIVVDSELGKGSTFTVYLPLHEARGGVRDATQNTPTRKVASGSETVLLVEDEARVRKVTGGILRRHGYKVLEAENANAAISCYREHARTIDMVITDCVMPGQDGLALAQQLKSERPDLPVLCISGYPQPTAELGLPFLSKPLTPTALLHKMRQLLDAKQKHAQAV